MLVKTFRTIALWGSLSIGIVFLSSCSQPIIDSSITEKNDNTFKPIVGVAALGQLSPKGDIRSLAAPFSGFGGTPRVYELLVEEGDSVKQGQILAVFDNRNRALADLNVAIAYLETIEEEIKRQNIEVSRYQAAAEKGAISLISYEVQKDELTQLKGQRNQTKEELVGLKYDLDQSQLKSPINGVILRVMAREGERPSSEGVLKVGATKKMEALIEVYESDIDRVRLYQNVNIVSENGGFDGSLSGRVSLISPEVRQRRVLSTDPTGDADARIVEVRVTLDPKSALIVKSLSGMKVIARFEPF